MVKEDAEGHTVVGPDPPGTHKWPQEKAEKIKRPNSSRFKPGQCGNPNKIGLGAPLSAKLRRKVLEVAPPEYQRTPKEKRIWIEILVDKLLRDAMKNPISMEKVWDRVDGRVPTAVVGVGGGPVELRFVEDGNANANSARN